jgi:uncharacterized membrane protein
MKRLGWRERPENIYQLQAAAAVGQMGLISSVATVSFSLTIGTVPNANKAFSVALILLLCSIFSRLSVCTPKS